VASGEPVAGGEPVASGGSSALSGGPVGPSDGGPDVARIQRRTLGVLILTQIIGGVGVATAIAVGGLLAAAMGGVEVSGLAQSALVVGGALLAVPASQLMRRRGRRPGLAAAYAVGAIGAVVIVVAARMPSVWLLFVGLLLLGGANTANYQARYTAIDLARPDRRGRNLSLVVWATTIGAVAGPNLAPMADAMMRPLGTARYSGPFILTAVALVVAAVVIVTLLRPDPLLVARTLPGAVGAGPVARGGIRAAVAEVRGIPAARLGIAAVAVGHVVMVGVMAMTPVHIGAAGHPDTLRIVGIVLSLHVAGMYALSPVTGWLSDRFGRRVVILGGVAVLLAACAVSGTAGHDTFRLSVGLVLLGLGWSGTMVGGSTLLSESVGPANKPAVQGLSDLVMGLAGASAGAVSGVIVAWSSFATLTLLAAVATVPLIGLALRPTRAR
jgi:MFS family permease